MFNRVLSAINFKNLWLFLPVLLVLLYGAQGIAGVLIFNNQAATQLIGMVILGIFTYMLTYVSLRKYWQHFSWLERVARLHQLPVDWWIKAISVAYFLLVIYGVLSSEKIALWEAINGASAEDIANAREALFKVRVGWEHSLIYLNALFSSALVPYVLVVCYVEKKSYRHILLLLFIVSLLPSLEKALVIKAFLPLIVLAFNGYLSRRSGYLFIVLMLIFILGTTCLSKMGKVSQTKKSQEHHQVTGVELANQINEVLLAKAAHEAKLRLEAQQTGRIAEGLQDPEAEVILQELNLLRAEQARQIKFEAKYFPFGVGGQSIFLVNRILWIPYITAYDWLEYFHENLHDELLRGRTSLILSALTGQHQYPMEKEVFIHQFGAAGPPTAAANATFLVDAFVNFGWIGVVLFAVLFAVLTRIIDWLDNPAAKACYYYFAYQVAVGGLLGVLFSNGLLLLLILSLLMKPRRLGKYVSAAEMSVAQKRV